MPFRCNAKAFLLTWHHCHAGLQEIFDHINAIRPVAKAVGVIELHKFSDDPQWEDPDFNPAGEDTHVHFAVEWVRKYNCTNPLVFDYDGRHCDIKSDPGGFPGAAKYCLKEEKDGREPLEHFFFGCTADDFPDDQGAVSAAPGRSIDIVEACSNCDDEEEWWNFCHNHRVNPVLMDRIWNRVWNDVAESLTIREPPGMPIPRDPPSDAAARSRAILADLRWPEELDPVKSLLFYGPAGCGKTQWLKNNMPMPMLYIRHVEDLEYFNKRVHKSILFDDLDFRRWPNSSQIMAVERQDPQTIHVRHTRRHLPAGIIKVFVCYEELPFACDDAIKRRLEIVNLWHPQDPTPYSLAPWH